MKKSTSLAVALALLISLFPPAFAQQQSSPAPQKKSEDADDADEVVRITTNLVQVDAVVTKDGKQVTDLTADEFEILEDGRPQKITNFSYVALNRPAAPNAPAATRTTTNARAASPDAPVVPAAALRPEQVRRTIALVIDDLGLSFESMAHVREAMKNFVDQQMQPGDLVAILRTSAGLGSLQQFTSDKRILYAAIERVKWYPLGRGGVSAFAPIEADVVGEAERTGENLKKMSGITSNAISMTPDANANSLRDVGNEIDTYREEVFSVGTLGALNYVVKGLKELPGRKSAILFSDGISILRRDGKSRNVLESMRRLVDLANRASVVVYTMDARGLQTLGLTAQDNIGGRNSAQQIRSEIDDRSASYFESKNGLNYLAQQTGGLFIENTNDIAEGVRTVLDDQKGFYLIGYRPSESTFDAKTGGRKFYQLDVRVKRPGLKVRTRNGFYGIPETEARAARGTRQEQLYGALSSPFASGDVRVRLTSLYANDPQSGAFMRSLVHVDAKDLTFKEESNGARKCDVDVLALTFGDTGEPLDDYNATLTWTGDARAYENVLQSGLLYIVNVPIKRPGPYQLRLAVRDKATERTGSASQFIEVPDLGKGRLTLSGLILSGDDITAEAVPASASTANASAAAVASSNAGANGVAPRASGDPQAGPALRRLRPGMELFYNFAVYNAQLDRATSRPQLTTQVRLFRDGRELYAGKPIPVDIGAQTDMKNLFAGGRIKLSPKTAPGTYVLQVVVTDALAKDKQRTATRWIDFEIVQK